MVKETFNRRAKRLGKKVDLKGIDPLNHGLPTAKEGRNARKAENRVD